MDLETEELIKQMTSKTKEKIAGMDFYLGYLWDNLTVIATCGCGKVFAAVAAEIMILHYHATRIINMGVAGTLSLQLHIGDLAIATATVQHDMDTSALGDPIGEVSKIHITYFECDPTLIAKATAAAEAIGLHYVQGVIATGDQFVSDKAKKTGIQQAFNAIACEMEGGAVGHTCYINKVPYLVLRAISDEANGGAPSDFFAFAKQSAANTVRLLRKMLSK
jgi:adenosylhomocysteine nucleosidase